RGAISNVIEPRTAANSGPGFTLDFDVLDSQGTIVTPTTWTNASGQYRFGFAALSIPPGQVFVLGMNLLTSGFFPGHEIAGTALVAGSLAKYPGAIGKCAVSLAKNFFDQVPGAG